MATGSFEPECAAALASRVDPRRDAVDVGANAGFYSVLLAKLIGPERRVLAVEPTEAALARLKSNLARNGVESRVQIFPCALGDRAHDAALEIHDNHEEYSSFASVHPSTRDVPKRSQIVQVRTIDQLVAETQIDPGFIKIDVEGAELAVLRGAEGTLRKFRPQMLIELAPALLEAQGSSLPQVRAHLTRLNYTLEFLTEAEALAIPG